jgi:hypothetical protein
VRTPAGAVLDGTTTGASCAILAGATRSRSLQGDYVFSYQPNPGMVVFLSYGSVADAVSELTRRFT